LRLSDLFSMNDFLEIHWGYSIWEKAANQVIKDVGDEFLQKVDGLIRTAQLKGNILASCFSQSKDILSQWRAYSNDGNGYAIGFKASELVQLSVRPLKVLYDEKKQIKEVASILKAIHEVESEIDQADRYGGGFFEACVRIAYDLAAFKNPAFAEEKEIRFIHLLNFEKSNKFLKLVDAGGTSYGESIEGTEVKFRMTGNLPIPYIDLDFTNNGNVNPIKKVILGPKNDSLPTAISVFLETINIGNVEIEKSRASYR
jgi:hypothetical protein